MKYSTHNSGYTLVEVLVVMVIIGMTLALVSPNIMRWLDSRTLQSKRAAIAQQFSALPMQARMQQQAITISTKDDLDSDASITIPDPVLVSADGYCHGGSFVIQQGNRAYKYQVLAPYCEVTLDNG